MVMIKLIQFSDVMSGMLLYHLYKMNTLLPHLNNLLLTCVRLGVQDVLPDGAVKQNRFLTNHSHIVTEPAHVQVFEIVPVNENRSGVRVIEPLQELDAGGLATA